MVALSVKVYPDLERRYTLRDLRKLVGGILYLLRTGCQWRHIPDCYARWWRCYRYFRKYSSIGIWRSIVSGRYLNRQGSRQTKDSGMTILTDSQSVKWGVPHSGKGIDGHKKVKGIKWHLITDVDGLPINVYVTPANIPDCRGCISAIIETKLELCWIQKILADRGYSGNSLREAMRSIDIEIESVKSNHGNNFIPISHRWKIERTFAWFDWWRRLTRNYETLLSNARHMCTMAIAAILICK